MLHLSQQDFTTFGLRANQDPLCLSRVRMVTLQERSNKGYSGHQEIRRVLPEVPRRRAVDFQDTPRRPLYENRHVADRDDAVVRQELGSREFRLTREVAACRRAGLGS